MAQEFKPPPIYYRIMDSMANNVSNKKCEGVCLSLTITDVMSIMIRPYVNDLDLVLSPQPLIDSGLCYD